MEVPEPTQLCSVVIDHSAASDVPSRPSARKCAAKPTTGQSVRSPDTDTTEVGRLARHARDDQPKPSEERMKSSLRKVRKFDRKEVPEQRKESDSSVCKSLQSTSNSLTIPRGVSRSLRRTRSDADETRTRTPHMLTRRASVEACGFSEHVDQRRSLKEHDERENKENDDNEPVNSQKDLKKTDNEGNKPVTPVKTSEDENENRVKTRRSGGEVSGVGKSETSDSKAKDLDTNEPKEESEIEERNDDGDTKEDEEKKEKSIINSVKMAENPAGKSKRTVAQDRKIEQYLSKENVRSTRRSVDKSDSNDSTDVGD